MLDGVRVGITMNRLLYFFFPLIMHKYDQIDKNSNQAFVTLLKGIGKKLAPSGKYAVLCDYSHSLYFLNMNTCN